MEELINPDVPWTWRKRPGGQPKTRAATLKEDLARRIGSAGSGRWNKEFASLAMDLAQDRRTWSAAVGDAVIAMDADSSRAGWMSSQVQEQGAEPPALK